ncbi:MAG TPA: hypothetical protein VGC54_00695 [Planctomycetota bacterium]
MSPFLALTVAISALAPVQEPAGAGGLAPLPVAVLESGARVQCDPATAVGARSVITPFGELLNLQDPVAEIVDAAGEAQMLEMVQRSDLLAWARRAAERGLLEPLVSGVTAAIAAAPEDDHGPLLVLLEDWGARLDPVPARVRRDVRVVWMWEHLRKLGPAEGALLSGRLLAEIPGPTASNDFRIGLVELRRAFKNGSPAMQRAAAHIAARQLENDMRTSLVGASLLPELAGVRGASAEALMTLDPRTALGSWTLALWRGKTEDVRVRAAEHLGTHGGPEVVGALVHTLQASSGGSRAPGSTIYFGRQISLVTDFDVEIAQAASIADPIVTVVQEGIALEARVISTVLYRTIDRSLQHLTGAGPGRSAADWVRWYDETHPGG